MRKIVINNCYGGFSLSHKAEMELARRRGITLYPYVDDHDFQHLKPHIKGERAFLIHYLTKPLKDDGTYEDDSYYSSVRNNKEREAEDLVKLVEEMGEEANGRCAALKVVEIPDEVEWEIEEYDGVEWISEKHRTWR